jgi:hypothetical protein
MVNTNDADVSKALVSNCGNTAMDNVLPFVGGSTLSLQPRMTVLMTTSCFDALRGRLGIGRPPPIHPVYRRCKACSTSSSATAAATCCATKWWLPS